MGSKNHLQHPQHCLNRLSENRKSGVLKSDPYHQHRLLPATFQNNHQVNLDKTMTNGLLSSKPRHSPMCRGGRGCFIFRLFHPMQIYPHPWVRWLCFGISLPGKELATSSSKLLKAKSQPKVISQGKTYRISIPVRKSQGKQTNPAPHGFRSALPSPSERAPDKLDQPERSKTPKQPTLVAGTLFPKKSKSKDPTQSQSSYQASKRAQGLPGAEAPTTEDGNSSMSK